MPEIVELGIKVANKDLDETDKKFDDVTKGAKKAQSGFTEFGKEGSKANKQVERSTDAMAKRVESAVDTLKKLFGAYVSFAAVRSFIEHTIEVNKNLDALRGTLVSVTGSMPKAREALDLLSEWADGTPFSVNQAVDAFTQLRLRGIAPTEERMNAFGNIAAAQRRSLTDFTEAVAQANGGMFRGLTQFGIKVDESKGKLKVTFDGMTTTIKDNGKDLINYLTKLGQTKFGTGMVDQMNNIGGEIKKLGDETETFYRKVGDSGLTAALARLIHVFAELIKSAGGFAEMLGKGLAASINGVLDLFDWLNTKGTLVRDLFVSMGAGALVTLIASLASMVPLLGTLATAFELLFVRGGGMLVLTSMALTLMNMLKRLWVVVAGNPFGLLVIAITLVIERCGGLEKTLLSLQAGFVILGAAFAKFGINMVSVATSIWEGFKGAFGNVKNMLVAFKDDLADFLANPTLAGPSFDRFSAALAKGVTAGFKEAYEKARKDGQDLVADIDKDANQQLAAIGAKMAALDAAAKKNKALAGGKGLGSFAGNDTATGGGDAQGEKYLDTVNQYLDKLRQENRLVTMTEKERAKMQAVFTLENQLKAQGLALTEADKQKVLELVEVHERLVKQQQAWNDLSDSFKTTMTNSLKTMFKEGKAGMKGMMSSWSDMFYDFVAKRMSEDFFSPIFDALTHGLQQALSSGGGGGFLGSIFGSIFGGGSSGGLTASEMTAMPPANADGGEYTQRFTGGVDSHMARVRVNPDEAILVRRKGDMGSDGGANVTVQVFNNAKNTETRQEEQKDMFGGKTIKVFIDEVVASNMRSSGTQTAQAMRSEFGASKRLAPR